MMDENLHELPDGWVWTTLGGVAGKLKAGGTPSTKIKKFYENGTIPFVKIEDMVNADKYLYETSGKITVDGLNNSSAWLVPENSLLYSMYASYGTPIINRAKVATNQAIIAFLTPGDLIHLDYIFYYLLSIKPILKMYIRGTTQDNLNAAIVNNLPVSIPPLPEQKRIVAKIEELFTELDAGIEALKKVETQLRCYRQAVLKYAFEGNLTAEWRKMHKEEMEPVSVLLERIREERKKNAKGEYKELPPVDASDLPELPEEWVWATANELSYQITDGEHVTPQRTEKGVLLLSARNILDGKLSFHNVDYIPESEFQRISKRLMIESGDVLLSCSGTVGRSCVAPDNIRFSLVRSVAVIKVFFNRGCQDYGGRVTCVAFL